MDSAADAALRDAFPDRTIEETAVAGPSWNEKNETVKVTFTDGAVAYLKLALDGKGRRIVRERAVIEYVGANGDVRAPDVITSDADREIPYLATARMAGLPLWKPWDEADAAERERLLRHVGRALATLHAERFEAHGRVVDGDADGLELDAGSWTDVLVDTIEEMRALAISERFEHHFDAVIEAVEENREVLEEAPAALLHGDPAAPNCMLADGDLGFVDWERSHVGDPARDLYRARNQQIDAIREASDERLVAALHDGYREQADGLPDGYHERRPIYRAIRHLAVSGFFENYLDYREESADELAAWTSEEMDRRLDAIR
ncbi:phosphotransferase family protein [Natronomonas sp.]|uniref:phosphotransferase family protein n=1 Tax=Natronomonas sp. TaxID=2184060 RepID=UPI002FC3C46B